MTRNRRLRRSEKYRPPGIAMYDMPGDTVEVYRAIYEGWLQIVRNCSGMVADYNSMFLSSLPHFMDSGRRGRS